MQVVKCEIKALHARICPEVFFKFACSLYEEHNEFLNTFRTYLMDERAKLYADEVVSKVCCLEIESVLSM